MGNYIVIGGDGREYGPITPEDLRQWFAEGRLNGKSLVKSISDAEFRPLEKFPEFADLSAGAGVNPSHPQAQTHELSADYELDLGGCISAGWDLAKKNFGLLFACILVLIGIQIALSSVINLALMKALTKIFTSAGATVGLGFLVIALNAPVIGPLLGGVFLICLKTLRGQATALGEIFAGFQKPWAPLFLGSLLINLIGALCKAPATYVISARVNPIVLQMQNLQTQNAAPADSLKLLGQMLTAYASALPILLVCMIPLTYLATCWQFTLPLIIDKQLSLGAAMKTSWQRVNLHWWHVFGLTVLAYLIVLAGLLGCGVGILFTLPVGLAIMMYGYETIFRAKNN